MLHLLAIARDAGVDLKIDDFNRVGRRVPLLSNLSPHGKYHMSDLDALGGVPVVMATLLDLGLVHGDCLTVTGQTVEENLATVPRIGDLDQAALAPWTDEPVLYSPGKQTIDSDARGPVRPQ